MAPGNLIASAATRIALPPECRDANDPQANPICPISHPPNTPPYGLVSEGIAVTRMRGRRSAKIAALVSMPVHEQAKRNRRAQSERDREQQSRRSGERTHGPPPRERVKPHPVLTAEE